MQRNSESVSELYNIYVNTFSQKADDELRTFPLPVLPTETAKQVHSQFTNISSNKEPNLPIPILSPDLTWKERSCSTFGPV